MFYYCYYYYLILLFIYLLLSIIIRCSQAHFQSIYYFIILNVQWFSDIVSFQLCPFLYWYVFFLHEFLDWVSEKVFYFRSVCCYGKYVHFILEKPLSNPSVLISLDKLLMLYPLLCQLNYHYCFTAVQNRSLTDSKKKLGESIFYWNNIYAWHISCRLFIYSVFEICHFSTT